MFEAVSRSEAMSGQQPKCRRTGADLVIVRRRASYGHLLPGASGRRGRMTLVRRLRRDAARRLGAGTQGPSARRQAGVVLGLLAAIAFCGAFVASATSGDRTASADGDRNKGAAKEQIAAAGPDFRLRSSAVLPQLRPKPKPKPRPRRVASRRDGSRSNAKRARRAPRRPSKPRRAPTTAGRRAVPTPVQNDVSPGRVSSPAPVTPPAPAPIARPTPPAQPAPVSRPTPAPRPVAPVRRPAPAPRPTPAARPAPAASAPAGKTFDSSGVDFDSSG